MQVGLKKKNIFAYIIDMPTVEVEMQPCIVQYCRYFDDMALLYLFDNAVY